MSNYHIVRTRTHSDGTRIITIPKAYVEDLVEEAGVQVGVWFEPRAIKRSRRPQRIVIGAEQRDKTDEHPPDERVQLWIRKATGQCAAPLPPMIENELIYVAEFDEDNCRVIYKFNSGLRDP